MTITSFPVKIMYKSAIKFRSFVPVLLLAIILISCTKTSRTSTGDIEPTDSGQGLVTPKGQPDGTPMAQKIIGSNGGSLVSADGHLSIDVPAGAVDENTTFSITRITNTSPSSQDSAYRITPHDVNFKKKVTVKMKYSYTSAPGLLGIAYQNSSGVWMGTREVVVDRSKRTVSLQTDHFSDWTIFDVIKLYPDEKMLEAGTSFEIYAEILSEFLTPLETGGKPRPIHLPTRNISKYLKGWTLTGPGELNARREIANYHAPEEAVDGTAATVALEIDLHNGEQHMILCNITINKSGIKLSDGNKAARIIEGYAHVLPDNTVVLHGGNQETGHNELMLTWNGGSGKHLFSDGRTQFLYTPIPEEMYVHFYKINQEEIISGGFIEVTDLGNDDGYVKGSFTVDAAGFAALGNEPVRYGKISGSFKVKRLKR